VLSLIAAKVGEQEANTGKQVLLKVTVPE